ncbi:MAG TPA: molybdopterin-dependent oxidoreductase [Verrucomicrobiae bacterium]|nr:molybdopterin-dependent oxidoreductase [Verrucomicrobiae bacterium]
MIAPKEITLTIDGKACRGTQGQTILQVAGANGVEIPTLCWLKHLSPWGGCRVCIVEIQGSPKVVPSCSTPAMDGSAIITNSPRLQGLRRLTVELLFSERNHFCPMCPMNKGDCDLQQQGYKFGIDSIRYPYLYPSLPLDLSGKYLGLDHNRCILCTRCVRTCDEVEGVHTLDIGNRGVKNQIVVDLNVTFGMSTTCTSCGACVTACPTGALFDKAAAFHGPLVKCRQTRTTCSECPVGCGLVVYTKDDRIVDVFGDAESPVNRGHLCRRGRYDTWAEPRPRIRQPMVRRDGKLVPTSWGDATRTIRTLISASNDWQNAMLISPRVTNETIRALHGIGVRFDRIGAFVADKEAGICTSPEFSTDALVRLQDADAIVLVGAEPSRNQGVIAAKIRTAVRRRGARLVILHSRRSDLDTYADISVPVVSLERKFWKQVGDVLGSAKRPVLIYGPAAMSAVGVTILDRLIKTLSSAGNGGEMLAPIQLPTSTNSLALAAAGVEPVEDVSTWLAVQPLSFLHIVASDEPDGGARLLKEPHVRPLLEQIDNIVVQASYESELTQLARVVLPAAIWCEKSGTTTNFEGRTLPLQAALPPTGEAREDKAILEMVFA